MRWNKTEDSRRSSVTSVRRIASSYKNFTPFWLITPKVSTAGGTKMCVREMAENLASLRSAWPSATLPAAVLEAWMQEAASVSTTVSSQARHLPACHELRVSPSSLLPSDLNRPWAPWRTRRWHVRGLARLGRSTDAVESICLLCACLTNRAYYYYIYYYNFFSTLGSKDPEG